MRRFVSTSLGVCALSNAFISFFMSDVKSAIIDIKKRGIVLLSIPRTEALALPI